MQPFNIKVPQGDSFHIYTILPEESYYSIMSNDMIIAAVAEKNGNWTEVPLAKVHTHDLKIKSSGLHQKDALLPLPIEEIGREISLFLAGLPETGQIGSCD